MMCPPQSVNTYGTPSRRSAWARSGHHASPSSGSELDVFDVGNLLPEVIAEPLLQPRLDLPHALAADPVFVTDLLQRHRIFVPHERLQATLVDHAVLSLERALELFGLLPHESVIFLVGDGVGRLRGAR